jgi:acetylornithine/N-succinyldiaminopimelate aminotransferase
MAKGLAGGIPIGAMLTGPRTDVFAPGDHGTTFGGNPVACAAGIATVKTIMSENLLDNAAKMGEYWNDKLKMLCAKYPNIMDSPRGIGLMRAVHIQNDLGPTIVQKALEHGLLLNSTSPDNLRMIPPLILTQADLDEAAELLDRSLAEIAGLLATQGQ